MEQLTGNFTNMFYIKWMNIFIKISYLASSWNFVDTLGGKKLSGQHKDVYSPVFRMWDLQNIIDHYEGIFSLHFENKSF